MPGNNQLAPFSPSPLGPGDRREQSLPLARSVEITEIDALGQLRSLWDLLVKHQRLIGGVAVLLTTLVAFYSFKMQPVYQAVSRVDVESEVPFLQVPEPPLQNR